MTQPTQREILAHALDTNIDDIQQHRNRITHYNVINEQGQRLEVTPEQFIQANQQLLLARADTATNDDGDDMQDPIVETDDAEETAVPEEEPEEDVTKAPNSLPGQSQPSPLVKPVIMPPLSQPQKDKLAAPQHFSRDELRPLATVLGIEDADTMNKRPLVKAINQWKAEN